MATVRGGPSWRKEEEEEEEEQQEESDPPEIAAALPAASRRNYLFTLWDTCVAVIQYRSRCGVVSVCFLL